MRTQGFGTVFVAALVVAAGSAMSAPTQEDAKYMKSMLTKGQGSAAARRALVDHTYAQTRGPAPERDVRVVYGADDRREVYEYDTIDATLRQMAEACAIVVDDSEIMDNGDGTYTLFTSPWTSAGGTLCPDEPFRGQPQIGFCSSFLVGPDIITTAGHCVDAGDISAGVAFIFGFQLNDSDETGPTVVPEEYVYFGTGIITQTLSGDDDYSVVQLDRPVVGINPVPVRRTGVIANGDPIAVIGHPAAILKKVAGGANVQNNSPAEYFQANLDTYGGNSGSMVINLNTYEVEGILVRGAPDYETVGGCVQTNYVPDTGSPTGLEFEEVSKVTRFESFIPPLGITVSPGGTVTHYGAVGGPFTDPTVGYTLNNTTSDPADYEVSLSNAAAGVLINGGTSPVTGTIPANSTAMISVTLDASVNGFAAGVYSTDITFEDQTNSITSTASHVVEVGQTLVDVSPTTGLTTGGPIGGPFPGSAVYTVTSERPTAVDVMISGPSWIDIAPGTTVSLSGEGDSADVTISVGGDASTLAAGLYTGDVTFTNLDNLDEVSVPVSLDVGRYIFASTDTPIAIEDNSVFTSMITFTEDICVGDVDVDIDLTHTYSADLIITLTSPTGTVVGLHNEGGGSDDFTPRRWDDEAGYTLPEGPGMLSDFDGELAAGTWILTVEDDAGGDTGTLNSWSLRVASDAGGCPPAAFDSTAHVPENGLATIALDAAAAGGASISYTITSLPSVGTLWEVGGGAITSVPAAIAGDEVIYRALPGSLSADSFGFTATADAQESDEATVTVIVDAATGVLTLHEFDLDTDPGFTTEGQWAWGVPTGQGGATSSGPDPTSGFTGDNVYGYNLNGNYTDEMDETYLTSTAMDVSGAGGLELSFYRWLGIESSTYDHASIDVSADGGAWQRVWTHEALSFGDDAWIPVSYDLTPYVAGASSIQVRWVMGTTDTSVTYPGWNIDDIAVTGTAATLCPADLDGNGSLNLDDLDAFIAAYLGASPLADLNGDGAINLDDLDAFIAAFLGC